MALTHEDFRTAAESIGCDVAALRAVIEVEAAGKPLAGDGRPIVLFEPHIFYRQVPVRSRAAAVKAGVAYKFWKTKPYPRTQAARWKQFQSAASIDRPAAIRSMSYGLGQIMGFNFRKCGFDTEEHFFKAMHEEGKQLTAFATLVQSFGLADEMREHRWAAFAEGWNGPKWKENRYDVKLEAAYRRWSKT